MHDYCVDPKVRELAEAFADESEYAYSKTEIQDLAETIQKAIEDWFEFGKGAPDG